MSSNTSTLLLTSLICVAVGGGCGKRVERVAVSGTVTFDGESVEDGQVAFEPLADGKMEFGIIADGEYSIPNEFGLRPGEYLVRITGNRATGKKAETDAFLREDDNVSLEIQEQFIPPQYNTGSNLKIEIEPVEHLQKDFALTSE